MSVVFHEGRDLPKEFRRGSGYEGYGDSTQDGAAKIIDSLSPWNFLKGVFVDKPAAERAAQVELTRLQAQAQGQSQLLRSQNMEELLQYAAIGVGALVIVILLTKKRAPAKVGGYRRSKKSRRTKRS